MATASYVGSDAATQGTWHGVYGSLGHYKREGASGGSLVSSLPAGLTITPAGASQFTYISPTADVRALQRAGDPGTRDAVAWYSAGTLSFAIAPSDATTRRLSLYVVDWDNQGRSQLITLKDGGATLDTRTASSFSGGVWHTWDISGAVTVEVAKVAGPNSLTFGLFLDEADGGETDPIPYFLVDIEG